MKCAEPTTPHRKSGIWGTRGSWGADGGEPQISPLPYALSKNISRKGRQHRDLSTTLRFGRDDRGEGGAFMESGLGQKAFFITLGGPQAHDSSGRDDNSIFKARVGISRRKTRAPLQQNCHLDRSVAQRRDLRFFPAPPPTAIRGRWRSRTWSRCGRSLLASARL
jgi:hypothetical protein